VRTNEQMRQNAIPTPAAIQSAWVKRRCYQH